MDDIVAGGRVKMDFYEAGCGWGRVFIWVGFGCGLDDRKGQEKIFWGVYVFGILAIWDLWEDENFAGWKNYVTSSDPHHGMSGGGCQVRVVIYF